MTTPQTIAVGFDGSPQSGAAVDWAANEADRRDASLVVVTAVDYPAASVDLIVEPSPIPSMILDEARELAAAGRARAAKTLPEQRITHEVDDGSVAGVLVRASKAADLLVIGNKRHGDLGAFFAGSAAFSVAAHAHCPVVVVPETHDASPRHGIVVGVDGSPPSQAALRLAADEAALTGDDLTILSAWSIPVAGAETKRSWADPDPSWMDAVRMTATALADEAAAAVRASHPELTVHTLTPHDTPARALLDAGKDAALLVVGSRGRGGFASLVLGSVSHAVMHGSASPVLVAR